MESRMMLSLLVLGTVLVAAPAGAQQQRQAKQALDDRADTHAPVDNVGQGTHFARKALAPGAYFNDGARAAVHKYYEEHPAKAGRKPRWEIGQALPASAGRAVPPPLLAALPKLPPGHSYLELSGDVLLVASGSRMVVDGIAATPAR